jgi:hypothetical protein
MNSTTEKADPKTPLELAVYTRIAPDLLLAAYGDLSRTDGYIYMMLPHWSEATIVFTEAGLVDERNRFIKTSLSAEEVIAAAGSYGMPNRRFTIPILRGLCAFEASANALAAKAQAAGGDVVAAVRKAALPKLTWGPDEAIPDHPAIVVAALAQLRTKS